MTALSAPGNPTSRSLNSPSFVASIKDPQKLFNSSLKGNLRRAIDFREGEKIGEAYFKQLIRARWRLTLQCSLNGQPGRSTPGSPRYDAIENPRIPSYPG